MSDLTSGARETIHLFTVDLPEDALWDFVTEDPESGDFPLRDALGVEVLDEAAVEGAVAEDLEGIGLTGFLTEGIGVEESAIAPDRARIDALSGSVVIVKGAGFDGAHVPLHPRAPLAHVGSWSLTPAPTTLEPLSAETARGSVPPVTPTAPEVTAGRNRYSLWLLLAVAAVLVLGLILARLLGGGA